MGEDIRVGEAFTKSMKSEAFAAVAEIPVVFIFADAVLEYDRKNGLNVLVVVKRRKSTVRGGI